MPYWLWSRKLQRLCEIDIRLSKCKPATYEHVCYPWGWNPGLLKTVFEGRLLNLLYWFSNHIKYRIGKEGYAHQLEMRFAVLMLHGACHIKFGVYFICELQIYLHSCGPLQKPFHYRFEQLCLNCSHTWNLKRFLMLSWFHAAYFQSLSVLVGLWIQILLSSWNY